MTAAELTGLRRLLRDRAPLAVAFALEAADAIAALPDVDGLLLGPADRSSDLGCPADLDGRDLRAAGQRIRRRRGPADLAAAAGD